jgi:2,3-bisphosphoglycerate-dependent phosphoglycerate mutase
MKRSTAVVSILFLLFIACGCVAAQGRKTIILIRHAEKETAATADQNDPPLASVGKERAERLRDRVGRFHPGAIYSTNFQRTRETVAPLAARRHLTVQTYDASKPQDLVNTIMASKTKRFVIVGHSNTIPPLVNLLTGKDLFKNLQDPEYSVIWVVRMRNGKVTKVELLDY